MRSDALARRVKLLAERLAPTPFPRYFLRDFRECYLPEPDRTCTACGSAVMTGRWTDDDKHVVRTVCQSDECDAESVCESPAVRAWEPLRKDNDEEDDS